MPLHTDIMTEVELWIFDRLVGAEGVKTLWGAHNRHRGYLIDIACIVELKNEKIVRFFFVDNFAWIVASKIANMGTRGGVSIIIMWIHFWLVLLGPSQSRFAPVNLLVRLAHFIPGPIFFPGSFCPNLLYFYAYHFSIIQTNGALRRHVRQKARHTQSTAACSVCQRLLFDRKLLIKIGFMEQTSQSWWRKQKSADVQLSIS